MTRPPGYHHVQRRGRHRAAISLPVKNFGPDLANRVIALSRSDAPPRGGRPITRPPHGGRKALFAQITHIPGTNNAGHSIAHLQRAPGIASPAPRVTQFVPVKLPLTFAIAVVHAARRPPLPMRPTRMKASVTECEEHRHCPCCPGDGPRRDDCYRAGISRIGRSAPPACVKFPRQEVHGVEHSNRD